MMVNIATSNSEKLLYTGIGITMHEVVKGLKGSIRKQLDTGTAS